MKKLAKKLVTFALAIAMVVSSTNFVPSEVKADAVDDINTTRNIALGAHVTCYATKADGDGTTSDKVTDGSLTTPHFAIIDNKNNEWHQGGGSFITIDLGYYYDASSLDEIFIAYKDGSAGVSPVDKSYSISYSVNGTVFETVAVNNREVSELGGHHETVDDVSSVEGEVRYVRVSYPETGGYGIQIKEIAVLATDPRAVQVTPCLDAKSVSVESNDINQITYSFEASEGQEGYTFDAYLDSAKRVGADLTPGYKYTVDDVPKGFHHITIVSKYDHSQSMGIVSDDVKVIDKATRDAELFTSSKNAAYKNNNAQAELISCSSFYDDTYTLAKAQLLLDGDLTHGEGPDRALRTKSGDKDVELVFDLGHNYSKDQFKQLAIEYQNDLTYASGAKVYVSDNLDNDTFTLVGEKDDYVVDKTDTYHVNIVDMDMSQYGLSAVRYVKLALHSPNCAYGFIFHEVGVLLNVNVADATESSPKNPIESPVIPSKVYTGSNLKADVPEGADYTLVSNEGGTDAGTYDVVLKLKDFENNYWKDNKGAGTDEVRIPFEITQADNEWTSDLTIAEWGRDETPSTPQISAKFGEATFTYSDAEDGEYTDTPPNMPGTYYVKATVAETANYKGLTKIKEFKVGKGDYPDAPTITADNTDYGVVTIVVSGLVGDDTANVFKDGKLALAGVKNGEYEISNLIAGVHKFNAEAVRGTHKSDKSEEVQVTVVGDYPIENQVADPAYNLALNKNVSISQFVKEGTKAAINDGNLNNYAAISGDPDKAGWGGDQPSYFVIDLGDTYDASTLGDVIVFYRGVSGNEITVQGRNYSVSYSADGVNYETFFSTNNARYDDRYPHATVANMDETTGAARYIRVYYARTAPYGMQVMEAAVIAPNAQKVEVEKCAEAKSVTAESKDYNTISYTIEAGPDQENFVYNVYLSDDLVNPVELGVAAGEEFEIHGVAKGTHTLTVVAVDHGKLSDGIQSNEVTVLDADEEYVKKVEGTQNLMSSKNNPNSYIVDLTSLYDENYNIDQAMVALDGIVATGEGAGVALRTQSSESPVTMVIDLGANYSTSEIETLVMAYNSPRTYAAETKVWVAERYDDNYFTLVADKKNYKATKEGKNMNAIKLNKDAYGQNGIRFVKIEISGGANNYGYVINEIGLLLNDDVVTPSVATPKQEVAIPTLEDKVYTGETVKAVIEANDKYTIEVNEGGVDAGEYPVTLKLKDFSKYYWSNDLAASSDTTDVTFKITQADNEWKKEVSISDWTYGQTAQAPSAEPKFGDVKYTYGLSKDGSFTNAIPDDAGTYWVKAEVVETANFKGLTSYAEFTVSKGHKDAPEDISSIASTLPSNADGTILNVNRQMEYRPANAGSYVSIVGTTIPDLTSGVYYVRYKETSNTLASDDVAVVVESGRKLEINYVPGEHFTYRTFDDSNLYTYGDTCKFEIVFDAGYQKGSDFAVIAGGEVLKSDTNVYTIPYVNESMDVVVMGVTKTPPTTAAPTTAAPKVPAKAVIKKVYTKKKSAKKLKVRVKAVSGAVGYRWAVFKTKKNAKKNKAALVKKETKKLTFTITSSKIKNKKTLFVRVRAFNTLANGTKQYGAWSNVKKVKVK